MHRLSCECLTVPKGFGGMGFKSLKAFNMAMMGKLAWMLLNNPDSLITRLLKARYFLASDFFCLSKLCLEKHLVLKLSLKMVSSGALVHALAS